MATVENAIDVALLADPDQVDPNTGNTFILGCDTPGGFKVATDGTPTPASITFPIVRLGLTAAVSFAATNGATLTVSGDMATLTYANMPGDSTTVTATITEDGVDTVRQIKISKVRDGSGGVTTYTWVKYADSAAGAGLSDDPTGKAYIGLAYNKTTATESTTPSDYAWSLIKGTDGVPGAPGANGQTLYTWIKYSDAADGTGMYDIPNGNTIYLGIAVNKTTATESTNPADYTWSKFKGDQGVPGTGQRGPGWFYAAGSAWNDGVADAATPGATQVDDQVTISDGTVSYTKRWNGSAWYVPGKYLDGDLFVEKSITAAKINTNGLDIRKPDGTLILSTGGLQPGFEAPDTKNSDLRPAIDAANAAIANISSDNVLSKGEKPGLVKEYEALDAEWLTLYPQADSLGVNRDNYYNSHIALYNYLVSIPNGWNDFTKDSVIDGAAFRAVFKTRYDEKQKLINALAAKASTWAGTTGPGKPQDYATVGADASNLNVGLGGRNLIVKNTLPSDVSTLLAAPDAGVSLEGPAYAGPSDTYSVFSPGRRGVAYIHGIGTPPAGTAADLYINTETRVSVVAGRRYEAGVTLSTHRCKSHVKISWIRADGAYISQDGGTYVDNVPWNTDMGGDAPRSVLFATAPAGASKAVVFVRQYHDGQVDPYTFTSQWYMGEALVSQTIGSPYAPSAPDIEASAADRLSKTSASSLAATVTLATGGAILSGTTTNGTYQSPSGFYGVQGGVIKFSVPISGDPTFAGQLTAAYGSFGAVSIAAGGYLGLQATSYNNDVGVWFGFVGGQPKFSIVAANGAKLLYDPTQANPLQLSNATVNNSTMDAFSVNAGGDQSVQGSNKTLMFPAIMATISGGKDPKTIKWSVSNYGDANIFVYSGQGTATVTLKSVSANLGVSGEAEITCTVVDANNRVAVSYHTAYADHF